MAWYIVMRTSFAPGHAALGPFEDQRLTEWYQRTDRAIPRPSAVVEAASAEEAVAKVAEAMQERVPAVFNRSQNP